MNYITTFFLLLFSTAVLAENPQLPVVSGCEIENYVLVDNPVVIGTSGFKFTPRCVRILRETEVTIRGSSVHPVQGMAPIQDVQNPFFNENGASTAPVTKILMDPGIYGYFCTRHGDAQGNGMAGAILVE